MLSPLGAGLGAAAGHAHRLRGQDQEPWPAVCVCVLQATWQPRLREALQMVREHENGAKQGDVGASQLGSTQLAGFKG